MLAWLLHKDSESDVSIFYKLSVILKMLTLTIPGEACLRIPAHCIYIARLKSHNKDFIGTAVTLQLNVVNNFKFSFKHCWPTKGFWAVRYFSKSDEERCSLNIAAIFSGSLVSFLLLFLIYVRYIVDDKRIDTLYSGTSSICRFRNKHKIGTAMLTA